MFPVKFSEFDSRVDHQYARDNRYSEFDLKAELASRVTGFWWSQKMTGIEVATALLDIHRDLPILL